MLYTYCIIYHISLYKYVRYKCVYIERDLFLHIPYVNGYLSVYIYIYIYIYTHYIDTLSLYIVK